MMNRRTQVMRLLVCLAFVSSACSRGDETPPPDQQIDILPAGAPDGGGANQPATSSKIGTLPLMAAIQPGGKCEIKAQGSFSVITRDVRYEENFPPRVISVGLGDSTRAYQPINLEANIRRESGLDQHEMETIHVIFNANGNAQAGNRQYFASATSAGERRELTSRDVEQAKQLIAQLLDTCKEQ